MACLNKLGQVAAVCSLIGFLAACTTVKGFFPDKEKQYQYSYELPPLEVPPDLSASSLEGAPGQTGGALAASRETDEYAGSAYEQPAASPEDESPVRPSSGEAALDTVPRYSRLVLGDSQPAHIELDEPFPKAWLLVGKTLSRLELEVAEQNREEGVYRLIYSADEGKKYEDRGLWGDLTSFFKSDEASEEHEYQVKLDEKEGMTRIVMLDENGAPLSKGVGLRLLQMIQGKIQALSAER